MKKILLLVVLIFLVSCAAEKEIEKDIPLQEDKTPESIKEAEEITKPVEESIMQKLYNDAKERLEAYEFMHNADKVFVHKNKMKILFSRAIRLDEKKDDKYIYLTEAYVDKASRTVKGYCNVQSEKDLHQVTDVRFSVCHPFSNITFDLSYYQYDVKTPLEWLKEFQYKEPSSIFDATQTIKIGKHWRTVTPVLFFTEEDRPDTVFRIDSRYNIPVRVEVYDNEIMASKYDYSAFEIAESIQDKKKIENKVMLNLTHW